MKVTVFSTQPYDREYLERACQDTPLEMDYFKAHLNPKTAALAQGSQAVCCFVNDDLSRPVLERLQALGVSTVALRCAGFNNLDLVALEELGLAAVRVPAYSPNAVAEHTLALLMCLNRKLHRAHNRVREGNFSLDGLMGFDLVNKTVGIVGTGKIGALVARLFHGFGSRLLASDLAPNPECEDLVDYVSLDELLKRSDVVTLHCPLTPETFHLIGETTLPKMKSGAVLVNTSRGGLVDTPKVVEALKSGHLGGLALDVYEEEGDLFFQDLSGRVIQDDIFARLTTFPNVLITGHQAFFTREAMTAIAETTVANLVALEQGRPCANQLGRELIRTK